MTASVAVSIVNKLLWPPLLVLGLPKPVVGGFALTLETEGVDVVTVLPDADPPPATLLAV